MMKDARIRDCVCDDCASRNGWKPKDKAVGMWVGKCEFCGETRPLTSLHHDWEKKAVRRGKTREDNSVYIVHKGVRYRIVEGRDCTNHCSFRKADGPYYCERGCYLPRWFTRLHIGVACWLEREDPKVELIKAVAEEGEAK